MIGKRYSIAPQPPVEEHTRYVDAGVLRIGVEFRSLDPESLEEAYKDQPHELEAILAIAPPGGFVDEGVSVHICDSSDGYEYLRFDMFDDGPHYHYIQQPTDGTVINCVLDFDVAANGDMMPWVFQSLRTRLPMMLEHAGAQALAQQIDSATLADALVEVEALCRQARADMPPPAVS